MSVNRAAFQSFEQLSSVCNRFSAIAQIVELAQGHLLIHQVIFGN